jgi:hypothetical protein
VGKAQENEYKIKLNYFNQDKYSELISLISRVSNANTVSFNKNDSVFLVKTTRNLDKNVIMGKLQKNFFSVAYMYKIGEDTHNFPALQNTSGQFKDAEIYDQEKTKWVKENPEAYKKMVENSNKQN